ncbi:MAG: TRM11 family methyltransferase [Candidatus Magasanikbacteria bacterium]
MNNLQPEDFELETSTVWSYPKRGKWATHTAKYRGNWAPQVARNVLLRYSDEEDVILDPMMGSGTTLIEAKLTGRKAIGLDVNTEAVELTEELLDFDYEDENENCFYKTNTGDTRDLDFLEKNSVDLIATHPPYANIIEYSEGEIEEDLSNLDIEEFYEEMEQVAQELYRVLKPGKFCALLMGDTRQNKHYIPLSTNVMKIFLEAGFVLKEDIIKHQWNTKTEGFWAERSKEYNFLLIKHEHLFVFRKPEPQEDLTKMKYSK